MATPPSARRAGDSASGPRRDPGVRRHREHRRRGAVVRQAVEHETMSGKPGGPFVEPMATSAVDGEVAITGPGQVHGSFTPQAARESAARLNRAADEAERQAQAPQGTDGQDSQTGSEAR
jgi:hypothetical protein